MTTYPCACSRGSSPTPGVPCASCLARRTPRALPPLAPVDRAGFVLAPPVPSSPPRRLPPAPPVEVEVRTALDAVCVTPFCGQRVVRAKFGPKRSAECEGKCGSCINVLRAAAEKRARLRRHGVAA